MPIMDGYEIARQFRSARPDMPIFALSAECIRNDDLRWQASGMNGVFKKPIETYEFISKLVESLNPCATTDTEVWSRKETECVTSTVDWERVNSDLPSLAGRIRYLSAFIDTFENTPDILIELYHLNDTEGIRKLCHKLKGTAGIIKCLNLRYLSVTLEDEIKSCNYVQPTVLNQLIECVDLLIFEVRTQRQNLLTKLASERVRNPHATTR